MGTLFQITLFATNQAWAETAAGGPRRFGLIITTVACQQGFATSEGAVGVGRATRKTVIISFLTILVVGYMVTRLFYK